MLTETDAWLPVEEGVVDRVQEADGGRNAEDQRLTA
jgi:hypothetical protein